MSNKYSKQEKLNKFRKRMQKKLKNKHGIMFNRCINVSNKKNKDSILIPPAKFCKKIKIGMPK